MRFQIMWILSPSNMTVVAFSILLYVVTNPESQSFIPSIQTLSQTNKQIITRFKGHDELNGSIPPNQHKSLTEFDFNSYFHKLEEKINHLNSTQDQDQDQDQDKNQDQDQDKNQDKNQDKTAGFNLEYLKEIYDSINSQLSTSMTIKDDSIEADLLTFHCLSFLDCCN